MKSALFSFCLSAAALYPTLARAEGGEPPREPGRRIEQMKQDLGLSDDQAKQMREIFKSTRGNCFEKADGEERRACHEQTRDARQKQLAQVLNPDQMDKLRSFREQHKAEWQEKRQERRKAFCEHGAKDGAAGK